MSDLFSVAAVSLVAALLSVLLRKNAPETAMLVGAGLFAVVLTQLFSRAQVLAEEIGSLLTRAGLDRDIFIPMVKILGISVLTTAVGAVCEDAGERAAAAVLKMAGLVCAFGAMVPLLSKVVDMILVYL